MKKYLYLLLAMMGTLLVSCGSHTAIEVSAPELEDGTVYLVYAEPDQINAREQDNLAKAEIKNGKVTISLDSLQFKGKVKECTLSIVSEKKKFAFTLPFPVEKGKTITLTLTGIDDALAQKSPLKISYSGSKRAEDFSDFWTKINENFALLNKTDDVNPVYAKQVEIIKDYIKDYPESGFPYSLIISQIGNITDDSNPLIKYCETLENDDNDNVWKTYLVNAYKDRKLREVTASQLVFSAIDINEKEYKETDVIGKSKLLLVDFWASWCKPCVEAIPTLENLYAKYHAKGLEIVSISLDTNPNDWLKYSKEHRFQWLSLLGNGNEITQRYNFKMIPYVLVVDATGKVIDRNIQAEKLEQTIQKHLSE